jgi:hypothetical protein
VAQRRVLNMEEVDPLPEDLCLVVVLYAEALARMAPSQARFEQL